MSSSHHRRVGFVFISRSLAAWVGLILSMSPAAAETHIIDQPNVNKPFTEHPDITFQPGDRIVMHAEGCVQTGGHGQTWKHYVRPLGDAADRLYHGLVFIPGVTPGPVRIGGIVDRPLDVPVGVDPRVPLTLTLGYEDDNYADNGYYNHDDGTDNQCRNIGSARVTITVQHGVNSAPGPNNSTGSGGFDLWWPKLDPNGFPWLASWAENLNSRRQEFLDPALCNNFPWTASGPAVGTPPCMSYLPTFDSGTVISTPFGTTCHGDTFGSNGHINLGVTTWQGAVTFTEESEGFRNSGIGSDHDINLDLTSSLSDEPLLVHNAWPKPPDRSQPPPSLLLEFDRTETIDNYGDVYWSQLRTVHDAALQRFFSDGPPSDPIGRTAVVTGLLGIDSVHEGWTELHPVYALAMSVPNSQVRRPQDSNTEPWAYFIRNWGNEGFCARNDHPIPFLDGRYVFRLPWKAGMGMVIDDGSEFHATHRQIQPPVIEVERDAVGTANAVLVRFTGFPDSMAHAQVNGVLHLRWTPGSPLGTGLYAPILKWLTW